LQAEEALELITTTVDPVNRAKASSPNSVCAISKALLLRARGKR
jgi:hypothetical protein